MQKKQSFHSKLKKVFFIFLLAIIICNSELYSQSNRNSIVIDSLDTKALLEEGIPDPEEFFIGKEATFNVNELQSKINYPKEARLKNLTGQVMCKVLINENGKVGKIFIQNKISELLISAAIDAILEYNDFKPAISNGKEVKCWLSIPINFSLR